MNIEVIRIDRNVTKIAVSLCFCMTSDLCNPPSVGSFDKNCVRNFVDGKKFSQGFSHKFFADKGKYLSEIFETEQTEK